MDCDVEVEFSNGEKIVCHKNHEWIIKRRTKDFRKVETKNLRVKDCIPFSEPREYPKRLLPIDPYFLGAWLGDGTKGKPSISNSFNDKAIIERIPYSPSKIHIHKQTGVRTVNYFKVFPRGLIKDLPKRIPREYIEASISQRLELLAGLIDTDGHVNKQERENGWRNGRVYITNIRLQLVNDIVELVRGLGMRTSVTRVEPALSSSGIQGKQPIYYIGFQPTLDIPTAIKRKKITPKSKYRHITVKAIRAVEPQRGKCVNVEGGVYCIGENHIPTHNSLFVALACVIVACIQGEMIAVVASSNDKAKIIMRYFIEHLGDSPLFYTQLDKTSKLEKLRMEENKERIVLRNHGGIYVISSQAGNSQKGIESAMGAGAKIVILDEAGLTPDNIEATIFRMIAGKGNDAFYCKIGNPFYRNHFMKSSLDKNYHQIFIDYIQGLKEGRYTEQFIEEAKKKPHFEVLFSCKFPPEDFMDDKGFIRLLNDEDIEKSLRVVEPFGEVRIGVDIAEGGGDYNVIGLRTANWATVLMRFQNEDTMSVAGHTAKIRTEREMRDENIFLDEIGVGKGVVDRLKEQNIKATGVKFSEKPDDETQFVNLRAECYWRFKEWIRNGGALDPKEDWSQLYYIKYKVVDSSGKMLIISKDDLRRQGIGSPDVPDAIAMTFARRKILMNKEEKTKREDLKQFDAFRAKRNFTGSRYLR